MFDVSRGICYLQITGRHVSVGSVALSRALNHLTRHQHGGITGMWVRINNCVRTYFLHPSQANSRLQNNLQVVLYFSLGEGSTFFLVLVTATEDFLTLATKFGEYVMGADTQWGILSPVKLRYVLLLCQILRRLQFPYPHIVLVEQ